MENREFNQKAINDAYKNAHLALQSINDILPAVEDKELKEELQNQYDGYERVIGEISSLMSQKELTPKDVNPFKKAMMWGSIKMKTLMNNSKNQIADMMIKGTVMGINELKAMVNEQSNLDPDIEQKIKDLLSLEEEYEQRLKEFL